MLDNLNEQLARSRSNVRSKRKLKSMLALAEESVQQEQSTLSTLEETLSKEKADVDGLEGLSMLSWEPCFRVFRSHFDSRLLADSTNHFSNPVRVGTTGRRRPAVLQLK